MPPQTEKLKVLAGWLACILILIVLIASIWLMVSVNSIAEVTRPDLITTDSLSLQEAKSKEVSNYTALRSSLISQKTVLYETIVVKAIVPLFTSIIGILLAFVFAKAALTEFKNFKANKAS